MSKKTVEGGIIYWLGRHAIGGTVQQNPRHLPPDADPDPGSYPDENPAKFLNYLTFMARVDQRGLVRGFHCSIWTIEDAFERGQGKTREGRNALVKSALQHLLIIGDAIYLELKNVDSKRNSKHDFKQDGWWHWFKPKDVSKQDKWRQWRKQVRVVASQKTDHKTRTYDHDTVAMAGRALVAMEMIERVKGG
nr:hypothetical protein CFP56_21027 [Quercus suber]